MTHWASNIFSNQQPANLLGLLFVQQTMLNQAPILTRDFNRWDLAYISTFLNPDNSPSFSGENFPI